MAGVRNHKVKKDNISFNHLPFIPSSSARIAIIRLTRHCEERPKAEVILWAHLKGKQFSGLKFRHQYSIGDFGF